MRGGERVLERLCGLFPGADIFTLIWNRGAVTPAIERHAIRTSFVQHLPSAASHYRWYLPLFPAAAEGFDLSAYDVVVSSTHCVASGVRTRPDAFHISYVHTPMRYIWELEDVYFPPGRFPWPLSRFVRDTCARLRSWDVRAAQRPHALVANSAHVRKRIARHWKRDATVVHPPVDLDRFSPGDVPRDYDLLAGAFAPYKRGDLAIEACRRLGRRLKVVGTGQEQVRLRAIAGPDVEFLGWVGEDELPALYRGARTLIFPGEEDFGIVPVEAMASGCPVIAFGRGGALETVGRGMDPGSVDTVRNGGLAPAPGGVLFGMQTVDALCDALRLADAHPRAQGHLAAQARPFSPGAFDDAFMRAFEEGRAARSP
jgi:glycosyltransferase involved in cell wall biosynthesis